MAAAVTTIYVYRERSSRSARVRHVMPRVGLRSSGGGTEHQ
jgi:hypothetical protein